jgi:hydrogenase nickel incorporation protein HypA/HybF
MRELQSIRNILNKSLLQARTANATRIKSLHLVIGEISELDQSTIRKHWDEISTGTPAEQAQLYFRLMDAEVQCMACFTKYHPRDGKIHCPHCGSYGAKIIAGEEFYLESIELDHE